MTPPHVAARRLAQSGAAGLVFFDSTRHTDAATSYMLCAPTRVLRERRGAWVEEPGGAVVDDPIDWLLAAEGTCWMAGFLGFEFAGKIDTVRADRRTAPTPDAWVGCYDAIAKFDHGGVEVSGDGPERAALEEAVARADVVELEPAHIGRPVPGVSPEDYVANVRRCIDAIESGELFEVNYTERWRADFRGAPFSLYEAMRAGSSGGWFGFLDGGDFQLASVSPEQFLAVSGDRCTTRPIKGTRARSDDPATDAAAAEELLTSEKDRAENVMIVDLMRNDLTRVCAPGTVEATAVCELESFAGVHHLVSTVEGELAEDSTPLTALLGSFPPGSITGAPKLRAIELIARLEATPRGPYTGTMFRLDPDGTLDSSVLIRTATLVDGVAHYGAGGAIVADSDPEAEYDEAVAKTLPIRRAMEDR